ncbi:pentapeptide repeat-containing protein [Microcoleus sp. Pol12B5]|uniref:pentapeptide repeat-containing protein n=1 Tax=Microcoleus sp. Pol12B5 TaxID=3055396 RepID=UPI00403F7E17
MRGAFLCESNLEGADLRGADLRGANLSGAFLCGANLEGAKRDKKTIFSGTIHFCVRQV